MVDEVNKKEFLLKLDVIVREVVKENTEPTIYK